MPSCFPFIKYWYILILFILAFICLFIQSIEIYGFGSAFAIQAVYSIFLLSDIISDNNRAEKALRIPIMQLPYINTPPTSINLPIFWVLLAGVALQFTSALLMLIACLFLYKKYQAIKVSRENRWYIQAYKKMFLIVTGLMFLLTYYYVNSYGTLSSGSYRLVLVGCFLGILGLSSLNVYYSNQLSKLIQSSTDG